ncbi:ATP-binding protein, partial [Tropicimonas sp.]|uniref:ATP-binding protein n=1 Tax=Tropicimonas sp. TaxID=2067044 RepID=UPI003A8BEA89
LGPVADIGGEFPDLVEGLGRSVRDWLEEAAEGRGLARPEFVRASVPDKELYLQITLGRVVDDEGTTLVAVLYDATELKTLEAQFVQSQKMQAIGQLAGGVAHDFNNLLTAISGHCDLLLLRHDHGDQDYGDLVQINQNANRAASLVGQLLAFSRKQNLQPEVLDLRDTLSDLTHLLNRLVGEKVSLSLKHDPGLRPIRADKRQLEQVLMNLVVNARDAMGEGGEIRIETESKHIEAPLLRDRATLPAGDYVVVRVSDEGVGIPADKLTKIFEPFFTTKRTGEGTGLGLSTAYGIVKQTGGYIFVDSIVGSGTTFSLYFPAFDRAVSGSGDPAFAAPRQMLQQEGGVVLLVEDEAPVRAFASRALQLRGFTVLEADSAEVALEILQDPSLKVEVFVTDVVMPGIDGPTWVREARKTRPDVRVVFMSGYAEESFTGDQSRIPNSVFLPKPFSLSELTAIVSQQIG